MTKIQDKNFYIKKVKYEPIDSKHKGDTQEVVG